MESEWIPRISLRNVINNSNKSILQYFYSSDKFLNKENSLVSLFFGFVLFLTAFYWSIVFIAVLVSVVRQSQSVLWIHVSPRF